MAVRKRKATAEKPARRSNDIGAKERRADPPRERPHPPEPFEECGPIGGYGGAGMNEKAKRDE